MELRSVNGMPNIRCTNDGKVYARGYELRGRYFLDEDNNLFNADGKQVTGIQGSSVRGYNIYYEDSGGLHHYPKTGVTVQLAQGFNHVGVARGQVYLKGKKIQSNGGFYIHRGTLYDRHGDEVVEVRQKSDGWLHYQYR